MLGYAVVDLRSSPEHPPGDAVDAFVRREDAEQFVDQVRGDNRDLASNLRIEERELALVVDDCPSRVGHRSINLKMTS